MCYVFTVLKTVHTKDLYINYIEALAAGKIVFKQVYLIEFNLHFGFI
jgi:hypothetical protein